MFGQKFVPRFIKNYAIFFSALYKSFLSSLVFKNLQKLFFFFFKFLQSMEFFCNLFFFVFCFFFKSFEIQFCAQDTQKKKEEIITFWVADKPTLSLTIGSHDTTNHSRIWKQNSKHFLRDYKIDFLLFNNFGLRHMQKHIENASDFHFSYVAKYIKNTFFF